MDSIHNKSIYNARDLTRYSHRKGLELRASISYLIPVTPELPAGEANSMVEIFDHWPEKYDLWFETPMGRLIKGYESKLVLRMLMPNRGEVILDAGCGTGILTADILETGARVVGRELAPTMLRRALTKCGGQTFQSVIGDMRRLSFATLHSKRRYP